jgi:hypothetical protein
MNIFRRPDYQSEVSLFIKDLKLQKPELEAQQRKGRDLLWDKNLDSNAWSGYRLAEVAQQAYVYQTEPS